MNTYSTHCPQILRVKHDKPAGKFRCTTDEYIIGYVFRGMYCLHDYYAERRIEIGAGHVYMLSAGDHICEEFADGEGCFEQIVFKFTLDDLKTVILGLSVGGEDSSVVENMTLLSRCLYVVKQADESMHVLFRSLNMLHGECSRTDNYIRLSLIVYFMTNSDNGLLRSELSDDRSIGDSKFEREVYANIYTNRTLEEIASRCCLSMSSFKRHFTRHFYTSPHRWFLEKRMCRACGMLVTSDMSICDIGRACGFFSPSHFIKVFKRHYGITPTLYRRRYADNLSERIVLQAVPQAENQSVPQAENKDAPKAENKSDSKTENKSESQTENRGESQDENNCDSQVENKGDLQVEDKGDSQVEDKGDSQVEDKGDSQVEDKGDSQVENDAAAER